MLADVTASTDTTPAKSPLFAPGALKRTGTRVAIVVAYFVAGMPAGTFRASADNIGFPIRSNFNAIESVLLTDLPNRWLQADWLQFLVLQHIAAIIYVSWFALPLLATLPLFSKAGGQPWRLVGFVMLVYYAGMPFFALYPLQPPWIHDPEGIRRIFQELHPEIAGKDANPFASMPSLHVALPAAVSLWYGWRAPWGKVMLGYACLIWLTVVYSGDHYVIDGAAGFALAASVYWIVRVTRLPLLQSRPKDVVAVVDPPLELPRAA